MSAACVAIAVAGQLAGASGHFVEYGEPQVYDAVKVFLDAEAPTGDIDGLLVCRVDVERSFDVSGPVDMWMTLTLADGKPREIWGPGDRPSAVVSLPATRLRVGGTLKLVAEHRRVTRREVARASVAYSGKGLRLDLDETQVECRVVPATTANARAAEALASARRSLDAADLVRPDLAKPDLNCPTELGTAMEALHAASAWAGESDEAMALRVRVAAFSARVVAAATVAREAAVEPGTRTLVDRGRIAVTFGIAPLAARRSIPVTVEALEQTERLDADAILADGRTSVFTFDPPLPAVLVKGAKVITTARASEIGDLPVLVRVRGAGPGNPYVLFAAK